MSGGNTVPSVTAAEHIGPSTTGDNIEAKRVALYQWSGTEWQRMGGGLVPLAYDYMSYTNTSTTVDTYTYKVGGAGGTTVSTVTITYTDTTKNQVSSVART